MPQQQLSKTQRFFKTLGPGILFASAAIGVSHLVQSTRAGATYGFIMVGALFTANLLKYPFFEYGTRYAIATGSSIVDGYKHLGKWVLISYFIITLISMAFVTAGVTYVTAGFCENLFGIQLSQQFKLVTPLVLILICMAILLIGRYKLLDSLLKIVATVLVFSTLAAFIVTLFHGPVERLPDFKAPEIYTTEGLFFLVALMGWMPTAVDLSSWNSLWTLEKIKTSGYTPTIKEGLFEFNLGYGISALLSFCFLTLGAYLMFGTGIEFSNNNVFFANQVVTLYTKSIGQWSYFIIAVAAFSAMFSTSITVFDGYARTLERISELLFIKQAKPKKVYAFWLVIIGITAVVIISQFLGSLKGLIDLVTAISFIIAPAIAILNFKLVSKKYVGKDAVPPMWMKVLSYTGILYLSLFTLGYIYLKFSNY